MPEEQYLWRWERFFLCTAERQIENANQALSEYVLEHLRYWLSALKDQLRSVAPSDTQQGSVSGTVHTWAYHEVRSIADV